MLKKILLGAFICIVFIFVLVIDESLSSSTYKENIQKIQASGILYQELNHKQTFFSLDTTFRLTLDKAPLISRLLFHLQKQNALLPLLSQLEGMVIEVHTKRYRYMLDHTFSGTVKIITLPTNYQFTSTLIDQIEHFLNQHSDLITLEYNIYHNTFDMQIDSLKHTFLADNTISYSTTLKKVSFHADFGELLLPTYNVKAKQVALTLFENNTTRTSFSSKNPLLVVNNTHKDNYIYTFTSDTLSLNFKIPTPITISTGPIKFSQQQKSNSAINYYSHLDASALVFQSMDTNISLQKFSYNIALEGLAKTYLQDLKKLLATIDSNNILYIYQDISKTIKGLLKRTVTINCSNISMKKLKVNTKKFYDMDLSFTAKAYQDKPLDLDAKFTFSQPIYQYITANVPNATLLNDYLTDSNTSTVDFTLNFTENALSINHKNIPLLENETNSTQSIHDEKSH